VARQEKECTSIYIHRSKKNKKKKKGKNTKIVKEKKKVKEKKNIGVQKTPKKKIT
jgi:hypothetical protein